MLWTLLILSLSAQAETVKPQVDFNRDIVPEYSFELSNRSQSYNFEVACSYFNCGDEFLSDFYLVLNLDQECTSWEINSCFASQFVDTYLALYDANLNIVAFNDDNRTSCAGGLTPCSSFDAAVLGSAHGDVSSLAAGDYLLHVRVWEAFTENVLCTPWNTSIGFDIFFDLCDTDRMHVDQYVELDHISVEDGPAFIDRAPLTYSVRPAVPGATAWRSVVVWVSWDPLYLAPDGITPLFSHNDGFVLQSSQLGSQLEITTAITGITAGQEFPADLFSISFDGLAEPPQAQNYETPVVIDSVLIRDVLNGDLLSSHDGLRQIRIDGSNPDPIPDDFFGPGSAPFCINGDFTGPLTPSDNIDVYSVEYNIMPDPLWYYALGPNLSGPTPGTLMWTLDVSGLVDGDYTIIFRVRDDVGHLSTEVEFDFSLRANSPVAPLALDVTPGYHLCNLNWTAGSDNDGQRIYRALRGGYPYPSGLTSQNVFPSGFTMIADLGAAVTSFVDDFMTDEYITRGVYDYVVVAYDCINDSQFSNVSSATNYFLGDAVSGDTAVPEGDYDGLVYSADLAVLAGIYGTRPTTDPERELNVGPTDDFSSYGLPAQGTTTLIDFEDLVIFAMNYGPLGPQIPLTSADRDRTPKINTTTDSAPLVQLQKSPQGYQLVLEGSLKAFSARIHSGARLLTATSEVPVFHYRDGDNWVVDVAGMNGDLPDGTRIQLQFEGDSAVELFAVEGRNARNARVIVNADSRTQAALPERFALYQNSPNPFNPTTVIRFALPVTSDVSLIVYNTLGQRVWTLLEEKQQAGRHAISFDASQLASGVYIYQLTAGEFSEMKKMMLVK